jgi:hypothetical protein
MHQTNMFQRQAAQPQAANVDLYDINALAPQFQNWNFQVGAPYDQHTPQIALMTANEIQQQTGSNHPIRIGMFNIISENGFNNASFQDLVYTIVMRVGHGITNGEWRNLDQAVGMVISRCVKSCASAMAAQDQEFMNTMTPANAAAVKENAEVWNYLMALAQGQAQYVSFNQMGSGQTGLSGVAASTQEALTAARNLSGSAGAFVESVPNHAGIASSRYNNNASATAGRYGRRAQSMIGKLEGSIQQALTESGAGVDNQQATGYQARMRRPDATATPPAATIRAAAKFDSDVTDFSKSLEPVIAPTPAAEPTKPLFTVQIGDDVVQVVRERKEGISAWKSSRIQRFHPAWCKRTHTVRYFESKDGFVIAMLVELTESQKEIAMNYDAHAIDPSMGQPDASIPRKPVREEAKVMYTTAAKVDINIVVGKKFVMEEDTSGAIRSTRLSAEMSEDVPDAVVKMSIINSPIVYATSGDAGEDAIVIRAIAGSKDFAEAASYLSKIRSELVRAAINRNLVNAVNRATECELGVGVRISDFETDGPQIIGVLEKTQGALVGEKMRAHQSAILIANVCITPATELKQYADATLASEEQEELSEDLLNRVLFLQRNVCTVWVNYTNSELAIGVPAKGPAVLQADSLGAMHKIAQCVYSDAIGSMACSEQFIVTKDAVSYRLHRGLLNSLCFLISKETH